MRRRLRRTAPVGGSLLALSAALIVWSWLTAGGFGSDLLLNLGASLVLAAVSYVIFDPIFEDASRARVQEHERFDQDGFIDRIRDTRRNIRILDTWTLLLDGAHRDDTFGALRRSLTHGATVRILLLDPDSSAARQRSEELDLHRVDVAAQIMSNLRHLHQFREGLSVEQRGRLRVSVYDASPSIQLYQWDGRALISFFPIGKVSFDVPQLEVDMASPWGQFVDRRFDELWAHGDHIRSLERYWRLTVALTQDGQPVDTVPVPYVADDERLYIDGTGPLAHRIADQVLQNNHHGIAAFGAAVVWPPRLTDQPPRGFTLGRVEPGDSPAPADVLELFDQKYRGYPPESLHNVFLLRLTPRMQPSELPAA